MPELIEVMVTCSEVLELEGSMPRESKTRPRLSPDTPDWFKEFAELQFKSLEYAVNEVRKAADENNRALKGFNGEIGLIAKFEVLERKVDDVFGSGTKIVLAVMTGVIGVIMFIVTTVIGVIIYHVLTSPS